MTRLYRTFKEKQEAAFLALIIMGSGSLGWFLSMPYYVGRFIDDALNISLAQSILTGHYRAHFSPLLEPASQPLPGYPLVLVLLSRFFGFNLVFLKLTSLLISLGTVLLIWNLLKRSGCDKFWRYAGVGLLAFNPTFLKYSCIVMAEPWFIFFTVLALVLYEKNKTLWLPGLMMGWACLFRPQGVFILAAVMIFFAMRREFLKSVVSGIYGSLFLLIILIRNYVVCGVSSGYINNLSLHFSTLASFPYLSRLKSLLGMTINFAFLQLPYFENLILRRTIGWGAILSCLFIFLMGIRYGSRLITAKMGGLYLAITLLLLPLWFNIDVRYSLVLLPMMALLFALGMNQLENKIKGKPWLGVFFSIGWVFLTVPTIYGQLTELWPPRGQYDVGIPKMTYQFIQENIRDDEFFYSEFAPTINLYTGKKGVTSLPVKNKAAFMERMIQIKIHYVIFESTQKVAVWQSKEINKNSTLEDWVLDPKLFELVYENKMEGHRIYRATKQLAPAR